MVPPATGHDLITLLRRAATTGTNVALRQAAAARLQPGQSWTQLVPPSAGHRGSPGSYKPDQPLRTHQPRLRSSSAETFLRSGARRCPWPLTHLKRPASFAPLVEYPKRTGADTRTGPFTKLIAAQSLPLQPPGVHLPYCHRGCSSSYPYSTSAAVP
ncbi:hypothetical protein HPB50_029242 [Hyalomma asiaticum]|nr:hypothetical protein HPB50_029242 [Hyalomma asiaticum]